MSGFRRDMRHLILMPDFSSVQRKTFHLMEEADCQPFSFPFRKRKSFPRMTYMLLDLSKGQTSTRSIYHHHHHHHHHPHHPQRPQIPFPKSKFHSPLLLHKPNPHQHPPQRPKQAPYHRHHAHHPPKTHHTVSEPILSTQKNPTTYPSPKETSKKQTREKKGRRKRSGAAHKDPLYSTLLQLRRT